MSDPDQFIFPPDIDYECTICGRCCSQPWEIPLDEADLERIRSVDWSEVKPSLSGQELVVPRKSSPEALTLRREEEKCVFLLDDHFCLIHRERGLEFKPRACQQFPYIFTETPAGTYVGVSFATSGIRTGEGRPLQRHEARLRALLPDAYHRRFLHDTVTFQTGTEISFEDALALEDGLMDILAPGEGTIEDDLVTGGIFLRLFPMSFSEGGAPGGGTASDFRDGWRRLEYKRIREIARKFRASPVTQRMFLTNFVSCVEAAYSSGTSAGHMFRSAATQIGAALNLGHISLTSLGAKLPFRAHSAVDFDAEDPDVSEPIRRYIRHVIFRKRLIPYCGVMLGYLLLCIYFALIRWFAQARAALRGSRSVEAEDVDHSIEVVERYYVLHTRFDQIFEHPVLQALLDRASRQKSFLGTIVRT